MVAVDLVLDTIYPETRLKRLSFSSKNERLTPFGCREVIFVSGGGCVVRALSRPLARHKALESICMLIACYVV